MVLCFYFAPVIATAPARQRHLELKLVEVSYFFIREKKIFKMSSKLHFTKEETEALTNMFMSLGNPARPDKLERIQVKEQLHKKFNVTDDIILDRIVRVFDVDSDNYISLSEWLHGLSVFLLGTQEEKKEFCFKVYDLNDDGFITREEVFNLLKTSMAKLQTEEDPDEGTKDLVDLALKKMDIDKDNKIGREDFSASVDNDILCMEYFGECLPEPKDVEEFLATHCKNTGSSK